MPRVFIVPPLPALMVSRPTGALLRTCATDHPTLVAHTEECLEAATRIVQFVQSRH